MESSPSVDVTKESSESRIGVECYSEKIGPVKVNLMESPQCGRVMKSNGVDRLHSA